jgi:hypothetical protein
MAEVPALNQMKDLQSLPGGGIRDSNVSVRGDQSQAGAIGAQCSAGRHFTKKTEVRIL